MCGSEFFFDYYYYKRYLCVKISFELGMGANCPFFAKLNVGYLEHCHVAAQYCHLLRVPSVRPLLDVSMACAVPTASYACGVWAFVPFLVAVSLDAM